MFRASGYEAHCQHYGPYKVFGWLPHVSRFAGHSCTNHRRKRGDRAVDTAMVQFVLNYYPSVATRWELVE